MDRVDYFIEISNFLQLIQDYQDKVTLFSLLKEKIRISEEALNALAEELNLGTKKLETRNLDKVIEGLKIGDEDLSDKGAEMVLHINNQYAIVCPINNLNKYSHPSIKVVRFVDGQDYIASTPFQGDASLKEQAKLARIYMLELSQ